MFRRTVTRKTILALAAFSMFVIAGSAMAQQGWPINGSNWSYYGGSSRPFGRGYSRSNYNSAPAFAASGPMTRSQSYYYAPAATSPLNDRVSLNLTVPADAKIWVEGSMIVQMGTQRQMVSPPIQPGYDYSYDIQVSWIQDGREVTRKRHITVHAGDVINLTFPVG
jgi:uncharacterized protein (TIGR03000 family)